MIPDDPEKPVHPRLAHAVELYTLMLFIGLYLGMIGACR
jgi:hypothetical protein